MRAPNALDPRQAIGEVLVAADNADVGHSEEES
jgi:hypothetical protein